MSKPVIKRQWLCPKDNWSNAYVVVSTEHNLEKPTERDKKNKRNFEPYHSVDASLCIADCHRIVTLEFSVYERTKAARMKARRLAILKIERLIDACEQVKAALYEDADNNGEGYD